MGTKFILISLMFLGNIMAFGGEEEQRKYVFKHDTSAVYLNAEKQAINGYLTEAGPKGSSHDLYLDTPELDLYKMGYSLRLRRKEYPETGKQYVFQLKSESNAKNAFRMEVEETELDFYILKMGSDSISLANLLDNIFRANILRGESRSLNKHQAEVGALLNWIKIKAAAPIAPFQKLKALNPTFFTTDKISELQPVVIGKMVRLRTYIYTMPAQIPGVNVTYSLDKGADLPPFFKEHKNYIWLYETSFDDAVFYPLMEIPLFKKHRLIEFEIENKSTNLATSKALFDAYEKALLKKYALERDYSSKYAKAVTAFTN